MLVFRFLTAGESHGMGLLAFVEGIPAQVKIVKADIEKELQRRRLGYGRGARMKFEADEIELISGLRHGLTLGSPIGILVKNSEWPKWQEVMSAELVSSEILAGLARNVPLTRPRPGHADLPGMQKYDWDEARPILERASARETAARVAAGAVAKAFLRQAFGIEILSHVVGLGTVQAAADYPCPDFHELSTIDADPLRCHDSHLSQKMQAEVAQCHHDGDTLGGVIEVLAYGVVPGLGTHISGERRLDAKIAAAIMGIQAIKGVEIGDGFELAKLRGSLVHDEIQPGLIRRTNHAGGIEGGISNGEVLRVRAAMKPIATVPKALATIDTNTGAAALAHHQRSDVCAVPAAGVVAEAMLALVLAEVCLEKFGGDSLAETKTNYQNYLARLAERRLIKKAEKEIF